MKRNGSVLDSRKFFYHIETNPLICRANQDWFLYDKKLPRVQDSIIFLRLSQIVGCEKEKRPYQFSRFF